MKPSGIGQAAAIAAFVALTMITAVSPVAAASQDVHVVQKGDTLWDISGSYLYDPFLWPQVWNANRFIENPHLIYPGQEILIPSVVVRRPPPSEVAKPALPPPPPEPSPPPAEPEKPSPQEIKQEMILALSTYGFIVEEEEIGLGTITSTEEKRLLIRPGMKVYITTPEESPLVEDEQYSIVRVSTEVIHPVSKKKIGFLARVLGDLTVMDTRDGLSTAIVGGIYKEAQVGDEVIRHIDYLSMLPDSGPGQPLNLEGYIVINPEMKRLLGKEDIVFIDLGSKDGLSTGDTLTLVERKSVIGEVEPPLEKLGELQIIVPRPETSVCKITESARNIHPGTIVISPEKVMSPEK